MAPTEIIFWDDVIGAPARGQTGAEIMVCLCRSLSCLSISGDAYRCLVFGRGE